MNRRHFMNRFIDYIENSCANLKDNHMTYLYKKKILDQMTDRANEIIHAGLTDENVMTDLLKDEFGDLEAGYKNFLTEEKKKRRISHFCCYFGSIGNRRDVLALVLCIYFCRRT